MKKDSSSYYIAPPIKAMLDKGRAQVLKNDWDRVYLIDGSEGSGKSLLGLQLGYYLDPTLTLDRVTFSGGEFAKAIDNAKKNECIIFDEAFNGLGSSAATSSLNKLIVRKLMECRQKNLFIIMILPTFFLLQRYAAIFRSKCLFHVYTSKRGERGYYRVYNEHNKKFLYISGQKLYSYSKPWVQNSYRFRGKYPINEDAYRAKKLEALTYEEKTKKEDRYTMRFALVCKFLKDNHNMTYSDIIKYLEGYDWGMEKQQMSRIISRIPQSKP